MKTRIISGAVLVAIALVTILLGGPVLIVTLLFCSLVGMYEMMRALKLITDEKKYSAVTITAFAGCIAYYAVLMLFGNRYFGETAAIVVIAIMAAYVAAFSSTKSHEAIDSIFCFVYIGFMLSFIYLIRIEENGRLQVWLVFLASWVADTCAYFTGRFLGKHKMAPVLSPKKTIEGAIGGFVGAGAAGVLFSLIFDHHRFIWQYFVICFVGAVISMFGDLAASAIKRDRGIKDYGKLIPGHGGIMDRFDSVIFTAPIIYLLTQILIARGV